MIRTALFWIHLVAGVVAGAVILVMSFTGVLLTYEKQMTYWADTRHIQTANAPASRRLTIDSLLTLAASAKSSTAPTAITLRADPAAPAQVAFGRDGILYLDRATGAVLGSGSSTTRAFFRSVTDWHRWLAGTGTNRGSLKAVTGAANLLFLVLVLSGMVLWLPRTLTWIRIRAVLWFRTGLSPKARDFNWHNVLGIWSALPLIAIVASGVVISYPWASDLVYKAVGEAPPARNAGGPPQTARGNAGPRSATGRATATPDSTSVSSPAYAQMIDSAVALMPAWKSATLQLPTPGAKTASVSVDGGTGGQPQLRSTVQLSTTTGAVAKYQPFDSLTTGRRLRSVLRFTHTGEVLGLFGQTLAGLVSLASVVLVITGISLAVRRAARAISRRGTPAERDRVLLQLRPTNAPPAHNTPAAASAATRVSTHRCSTHAAVAPRRAMPRTR